MKKLLKNKYTYIALGIILLTLLAVILIVVFKDDKKEQTSQIDNTKEEIKKINIIDTNSTTRPYAVMINNLNDARKVQSGLSDAYMVYEIIVEGGITRYLALFKDIDVEKIGSVRSARHYYLDYVLENDAYFVHWGYSDQAKEDIKTLNIDNINGLTYENVYFYRENPLGLSSEHTGFTNTDYLNKAVNKLGYRKETNQKNLLTYSADSLNLSEYESEDALEVELKYSNYTTNKYEYDEESKMYKRFVNKQEQKDYAKDEIIYVKNIIVYMVNNYTISGDTKGRQFLENIGSGTGIFISEGKAVKINWEKKDRNSQTIYTYENGDPLVVNDGNTFIQIMPKTGSIKVN